MYNLSPLTFAYFLFVEMKMRVQSLDMAKYPLCCEAVWVGDNLSIFIAMLNAALSFSDGDQDGNVAVQCKEFLRGLYL